MARHRDEKCTALCVHLVCIPDMLIILFAIVSSCMHADLLQNQPVHDSYRTTSYAYHNIIWGNIVCFPLPEGFKCVYYLSISGSLDLAFGGPWLGPHLDYAYRIWDNSIISYVYIIKLWFPSPSNRSNTKRPHAYYNLIIYREYIDN